MRKAFRLARLEKPGATHIELPEDVAEREIEGVPLEVRRTTYAEAGDRALDRATAIMNEARHPILLAGNGVSRREAAGGEAAEALREFVACSGVPATSTFMAKGVLGPDALPPVGLQRPGVDLANLPELADADVVIAVGYDLVEWAPVLWNPKRDKSIVHVDSTAAELDGHYQPEVEVVGEIGESLRALASRCRRTDPAPAQARPARTEASDAFPLDPRRVVADLRAALGDEDIVVSDVGAHKVWLSRLYTATRPNTVVIANGLAAMGIALPGAIAAKLVQPERRVVAFCGDGGFLMNVQELETAKRLGTAIVIVVLVDGRYGVIEMNEQRRFGRSFGVEFGNPDFVELARSFGIAGFAVDRAANLLPTLRRALDLDGPSLVAAPVDPRENAKLGEAI